MRNRGYNAEQSFVRVAPPSRFEITIRGFATMGKLGNGLVVPITSVAAWKNRGFIKLDRVLREGNGVGLPSVVRYRVTRKGAGLLRRGGSR